MFAVAVKATPWHAFETRRIGKLSVVVVVIVVVGNETFDSIDSFLSMQFFIHCYPSSLKTMNIDFYTISCNDLDCVRCFGTCDV